MTKEVGRFIIGLAIMFCAAIYLLIVERWEAFKKRFKR